MSPGRALRLLLLPTLAAALPTTAAAQSATLRYAPADTIDHGKEGIRGFSPLTVNTKRRELIVLGLNQFIVFDSTGAARKWPFTVGYVRGASPDIGGVSKLGWVGDSMWIADPRFGQAVIVDTGGTLQRSIEPFRWVRPAWRDRRRYPLFAGMTWEALYPDGSMLVRPSKRRSLIDSPEYDRSKTHLLRVDKDGVILKTIATIPSQENRLTLRDGMQRTMVGLPFFARPSVSISADGRRVAIVQPLLSASDSGAFQVTAINENGDTVFSRRHVVETKRVPQEGVDAALAGIKEFGRYSAEWIRDTVRKQIPAFESRVMGVQVGVDHSVWVWLQSPQEHEAVVLDSNGTALGRALIPRTYSLQSVAVDEIWAWARLTSQGRALRGSATPVSLVRLRRDATVARPARTAAASASPRR